MLEIKNNASSLIISAIIAMAFVATDEAIRIHTQKMEETGYLDDDDLRKRLDQLDLASSKLCDSKNQFIPIKQKHPTEKIPRSKSLDCINPETQPIMSNWEKEMLAQEVPIDLPPLPDLEDTSEDLDLPPEVLPPRSMNGTPYPYSYPTAPLDIANDFPDPPTGGLPNYSLNSCPVVPTGQTVAYPKIDVSDLPKVPTHSYGSFDPQPTAPPFPHDEFEDDDARILAEFGADSATIEEDRERQEQLEKLKELDKLPSGQQLSIRAPGYTRSSTPDSDGPCAFGVAELFGDNSDDSDNFYDADADSEPDVPPALLNLDPDMEELAAMYVSMHGGTVQEFLASQQQAYSNSSHDYNDVVVADSPESVPEVLPFTGDTGLDLISKKLVGFVQIPKHPIFFSTIETVPDEGISDSEEEEEEEDDQKQESSSESELESDNEDQDSQPANGYEPDTDEDDWGYNVREDPDDDPDDDSDNEDYSNLTAVYDQRLQRYVSGVDMSNGYIDENIGLD